VAWPSPLDKASPRGRGGSLLERLERYYDQVPRSAARVEVIGPFTLFLKRGGGFPYYARPSIGSIEFTADDVDRVRARQRQLEVPESFEWVAETSPGLADAIVASGLQVHRHPLQVLERPMAIPEVSDITLRLVSVDDNLARVSAVGRVAFGSPGTAIGDVGIEALASGAPDSVESQRQRLRSGLTVTAAAFTAEGDPIAVGSHQPVDDVSEIVGVGTLPAYRRRGIGAALTALLIEDALARGVRTVFLSAGDDDVARMYERVGFGRVGTACIAES
jgi:ribosomal protein S18 acetylase RimI-like enzyme